MLLVSTFEISNYHDKILKNRRVFDFGNLGRCWMITHISNELELLKLATRVKRQTTLYW